MRVLVDSTVWIDFFRAVETAETRRLKTLLANGEDICICGHVLAEILRGTRFDDQYKRIEREFSVLGYLPMERTTFQRAADIFRTLRRNGKRLKNTVDTFIAAVVIENSTHLLHNDSDFDLIAGLFPLRIVPGQPL